MRKQEWRSGYQCDKFGDRFLVGSGGRTICLVKPGARCPVPTRHRAQIARRIPTVALRSGPRTRHPPRASARPSLILGGKSTPPYSERGSVILRAPTEDPGPRTQTTDPGRTQAPRRTGPDLMMQLGIVWESFGDVVWAGQPPRVTGRHNVQGGLVSPPCPLGGSFLVSSLPASLPLSLPLSQPEA